jgi:P-type Cu+ transporter
MAVAFQYKVEGINCMNCANGIKSHLNKKKIAKVHIDIAKGIVTIYNDQYTANEIGEFINDLGYKTTFFRDEVKQSYKLEYYLIFCTLLSLPLLGHMFVGQGHFLQNPWLQICLSTPVLLIGYQYFAIGALNSIRNLKPNMNVLILMGASAAYIYSLTGWILNYNSLQVHHYLFFETAATIITLVLLGNYFEKRSITQTTTALDSLQQLQSKEAIKEVDGNLIKCPISALKIGDILIVNQGDSIPIDAEIIMGECSVDESMISGESTPVFKSTHQKVIGGTIILDGNIKCKVITDIANTILSQIIELVRNAQEDKPKIQQLGDKISNYFVPAVLGIAIVTFLINYYSFNIDFQNSILRAIAVLVISCPCAMGLATPTAVMVGVGRAAKNGVLIKGGSTIELFSKTKKIIFDKTGTLTNGEFKIHELKKWNEKYNAESIIYELEKHSSHPIAKSLVKCLEAHKTKIKFDSINEIKGKGFHATDTKGHSYQFGSAKFIQITDPLIEKDFQLFLKINNELVAAVSISDEIKSGARELTNYFNDKNIETILLSGDNKQKCDALASELNINEVIANQLPEDKIEKIKQFSKENTTAMFGDGINDAPALTKAHVGISYSKASEVAVKSASIVLLNHNLEMVQKAYQICTHTYLTIKQNLFWAFAYNIIAIPLASMGYLNPIFAALTMAFSDIVVIGNSIRLKYKNIDS